MSGIDASIPLSGKNPSLMSSLGDVMNVANAATQLKRQGVAYSQEKGSLDARNAVAKVVSDPQYHDPATGMFDLNKGAPAIVAADPQNYVAADTISKLAAANNDLITVKKASLGLADASRAMLGSTVGALATKPDLSKADIQGSLDQLRDQAPDAAPIIDVWEKGLKTLPDDPKVLQQVVMRARGQVMAPATQVTAQTPSGIPVTNNQQSTVVNTNPNAMPVGAPIPGTTQQLQLPPTTPTFNSATNQPGYLGPQPAAGGAPGAAAAPVATPAGAAPPAGAAGDGTSTPPNPPYSGAPQQVRDDYRVKVLLAERAREANNPDATARAANLAAIDKEIAGMQRGPAAAAPAPAKASFVASGPPLGTAENVAGTVDAVNKDWNNTLENARTASQDIGVLQNIKQYARGAAMGVLSDRRAFVAGLAGLLHMDAGQLEKTNTDLLAKNSNMLALAGGDTNLARTMAEMANPNFHMTPEAAEDAANQVIGQRKLALVKQQFMQNFKGDPEQYTKELAEFNKVADPRILQLPSMSRDEMARMKAAMSPAEQKEFGQKIRKMQAMGLIQ